jgi:hypothetical protein
MRPALKVSKKMVVSSSGRSTIELWTSLKGREMGEDEETEASKLSSFPRRSPQRDASLEEGQEVHLNEFMGSVVDLYLR